MIFKAHGEIAPHTAGLEGVAVNAFGLALANWANTPGTVARTPRGFGLHIDDFAGNGDRARPRTHLRKTLRIKRDARAVANELVRFRNGGAEPFPSEIKRNVVLVGFDNKAQTLERLDHFDATRANRNIGTINQRL